MSIGQYLTDHLLYLLALQHKQIFSIFFNALFILVEPQNAKTTLHRLNTQLLQTFQLGETSYPFFDVEKHFFTTEYKLTVGYR